MRQRNRMTLVALAMLVVGVILLAGWRSLGPETSDLVPRDTQSLLLPSFQRSEIRGQSQDLERPLLHYRT